MLYIEVTVDTNDADYESDRNMITDSELTQIMPLIQAIAKFEPYTVQTEWGELTYTHNFPVGECCRDDMGERTLAKIYGHVADEHTITMFLDGFCPYTDEGFHTIKSIKTYEQTNKQTLLEWN